ncbi:hypothetical protein ACOMHN_013586 [Nucella lapillus]
MNRDKEGFLSWKHFPVPVRHEKSKPYCCQFLHAESINRLAGCTERYWQWWRYDACCGVRMCDGKLVPFSHSAMSCCLFKLPTLSPPCRGLSDE